MNQRKIIVKNLFADTRSACLNGQEFIFKANQERIVSEAFLNSDGTLKFSFLTLIGFVHEDGSVLGLNEKVKEKFEIKDTQVYVYELIHKENNTIFANTNIKDLASELNLNYSSLCAMFGMNKTKFKEYNIAKFTIEEYIVKNPEFKVEIQKDAN